MEARSAYTGATTESPMRAKDTSMTGNLYFGGIPTEPDVKALRDAYPETEMTPNSVIPYEEVEAVIGVQKDSARFRTVTDRWRAVVQQENKALVIGTERGVGFKVLTNHQKLNLSNAKLKTAARSARRSYALTAKVQTDQLTEEERERLTTIQRRSAAFLASQQIKSKETDLPSLED